MFQQMTANTLGEKKWKKRSLSKETQDIKKSQMVILELKNNNFFFLLQNELSSKIGIQRK